MGSGGDGPVLENDSGCGGKPETRDIRKGAEVDVCVEKLAFGGRALGRLDGLVVFMDHGLPGQHARVRITRKKRQFAEGYVVETLSGSPHYVEPFCPHFGVCGGCRWQDLRYEEQLRWKRQHVLEALHHLAGVEGAAVLPAVASPQQIWYRNKMEFTFSHRCWLARRDLDAKPPCHPATVALGLHARNSFEAVVNLEQCFLESPEATAIVKEVREWCRESGLPAYHTKNHQGFWRFLVIREGKRTAQRLVHLLTTSQGGHGAVIEELARHLQARFPHITSFVHSITDSKAQVAFGDSSRCLSGPGFIEERLGPLRFKVSAQSFFQTNPLAAEQLYFAILELGAFTGGETVWDLYSGAGSIALFIADRVRQVVGFEVNAEAVRDARANCTLNGVDNCTFVVGDLKDIIGNISASVPRSERPDVIITDPPRAGMHPRVLKALLDAAPPCILTVSCNPATLARDLVVLLEAYQIDAVQTFDFFPHTPHIECLVKLTRK
jgi:23S rRNA (uracil1939-C5)-methyltransferase